MNAEERRERIWRVLLRHRGERGWEPVRDPDSKRLIGWVRDDATLDDAYPEELNYEPHNPNPIQTIKGEPNYAPRYPKSTE